MNQEDREIMDMLMIDRGQRYKIYVDNDAIFVMDKENGSDIHTFYNFGWEFIINIMNYLGLDCEGV